MSVFGIVLFLAILPNEWTRVPLVARAQGRSSLLRQAPTNAGLPLTMDFIDDINTLEMRLPFVTESTPHTRYFVYV